MASPNLAQLLGLKNNLQLTPSPERSQLVQLLQQQSAQPRQSRSGIESLDIASKPILAAILARQQGQGRQNVASGQQALVRAMQIANDPNATPGDRDAATRLVQTEASQLPPDNPVALAASEIGLSQNIPQQGQRIVQSVHPLENGNLGYVNAFTGEVVDTGTKFNENLVIRETTGGGIIAIDPSSGETEEVTLTPEEGTSQAATRAAAVTTATESAERTAEVLATAPEEIANVGDLISTNDEMIEGLKAGRFETGPIIGRLPAATTEGQLFQQFSGVAVVDAISSATFGQLSEGEREFLTTTVPSRDKTEAANIEIIERRNRILRRSRVREIRSLIQAGGTPDLSGLSEEELDMLENG